jgi:hypothetical protein
MQPWNVQMEVTRDMRNADNHMVAFFCLKLVSHLMSRYLSDLTFTICPLDVAVVAAVYSSQHIVPTS